MLFISTTKGTEKDKNYELIIYLYYKIEHVHEYDIESLTNNDDVLLQECELQR